MQTAERIIMVAIALALIGGGVWGYYAVQDERSDFRERVAAGEFEIRDEPVEIDPTDQSDWRRYYPVTYAMKIGEVEVEASVADTLSSRIKGLSDTPYLPENVVKLFAFGVPGKHSIWMKDMNYPIDIIWADEAGVIVHIVSDVSPSTYDPVTPQNSASFASPVDAWFVVETNAGFAAEHGITRGDTIVLPTAG